MCRRLIFQLLLRVTVAVAELRCQKFMHAHTHAGTHVSSTKFARTHARTHARSLARTDTCRHLHACEVNDEKWVWDGD